MDEKEAQEEKERKDKADYEEAKKHCNYLFLYIIHSG